MLKIKVMSNVLVQLDISIQQYVRRVNNAVQLSHGPIDFYRAVGFCAVRKFGFFLRPYTLAQA